MKNNALMICLLLALPLFSQKQNLDFRWPKMRTIAGLYYMFSLKEKGTVFHEQVVLNPMSGAMKISYVSADGKTVWVSDKIKNIGFRRDVFWDDKGFTIYQKNAVKKNVEYWHFDYNGKLTAVGKSKYEFPVITLYQSGSKLMAILESNKNDLKNLFIQEISNGFR